MIAYKGFRPGLICRGYQFVMGLNTTEKANCRENGFHCAEDPLDCLSYYSSLEHSEYYIVNAGGDIDEDEHDSKIACTELTVIKRLYRVPDSGILQVRLNQRTSIYVYSSGRFFGDFTSSL